MWGEAGAQERACLVSTDPSCHMGLTVCPLAPPSLFPSPTALKPYYFYLKRNWVGASGFPCPEHLAFPAGDTGGTEGRGVMHEPLLPGLGDIFLATWQQAECANQAECLPGRQRSGWRLTPLLSSGAPVLGQSAIPGAGGHLPGSIPGSGCPGVWREAHLEESLSQALRLWGLEGSWAAVHCRRQGRHGSQRPGISMGISVCWVRSGSQSPWTSQTALLLPKLLMELLWDCLPTPTLDSKGPRPFPSEHVFLFCRNLWFCCFFSIQHYTMLPKATFRLSPSLHWSSTVVQFPILPRLAWIKLRMYFVRHRFYIVMMSYAKRKKN